MQTTLFYKDDRSDKVYQAEVAERGGGFIVRFAFGRRGGPLTPGVKTAEPVSRDAAEKIYGKLIAEKKAKGYTEPSGNVSVPEMTAEAVPAAAPESAPVVAFVPPMLLNEADAAAAVDKLRDPGWMAQPKMDGIRLQIHREAGGGVCAYSRTGLKRTALPKPVMDAVLAFGMPGFVIDGELVGDTFFAFELLSFVQWVQRAADGTLVEPYLQARDFRDQSAAFRLGLLGSECDWLPGVQIIETAFSETAKIALLERLKAEGAEGIVLKQVDAPYRSGRPNSGGPYLKHKFVTTGSFVVSGLNAKGKRSVDLALADGTRVGSCTIPPNRDVPPVGAIAEVRYLYFVSSLVQACYLGVREDVTLDDVTAARQLKYKQGEQEAE